MDEKEQEQQLLSPAPKEEAQPSGAGAAQESGDAKESRQHRISHGQQKRRQRSVFQYIAILFAAAFVLVYQGSIALLAAWVAPLLSDAAVAEMTCAGSVIIIGLGLNMLGISKFKVMNFVPAIFIPIVLCLFM